MAHLVVVGLWRRPMPRPERVLGALGLVAVLKRTADEQVDAEVPQLAVLSARARHLQDRALDLAAEGRDDPAAVQELRAAAGRRGERQLRAAAAALRVIELTREDRTQNLANRLLLAAAADAAVAPLTEQDRKLIEELEALLNMPLEVAFEQLVQLEPSLDPLQRRIAALARSDAVLALDSDARDDLLWDEIIAGLEPILGPGSSAADAVTRSRTAFGLARLWLAQISGVRVLDP